MAALGAVAQHYIKFPGFDAGWQGRMQVARIENLKFLVGSQQVFCVLDIFQYWGKAVDYRDGVEDLANNGEIDDIGLYSNTVIAIFKMKIKMLN